MKSLWDRRARRRTGTVRTGHSPSRKERRAKKLYGTCSLFLGVDDWGSLEVKDSGGNVVAQVDLKENPQTAGEQGGHKYHTGTGGAQLPSGTYSWEVSQTNIDYNPASGNTSICNYSIDVVPTEPGGRKEPEPCPCEGDTCDNSGGTPPSPPQSRSGPEAGMESGALGNYSSAGCSVTAESTATLMYWSCNFGAFRGLGGLPAGRVELRGEQNVSGLERPSSLAYNHPLNSRLDVPEGGIVPGARFNLVQGDRVIAMRCYTDGSVLPIGVDTSGGGRAALATVEGQSCLRWVVEDGSQYLFSAETGTLLSYTTADRQVISNASSYLDVRHAGDGSLRQIWNLWDGLLNVENVISTGYVIALYTPGQITGTDEQGFYTVTGAPLKTFILSLDAEEKFTITEQAPARQPYAVTWWNDGLAWNMRQGTGKTPSRPSARARSWNRKTRSGSWSRKSPKTESWRRAPAPSTRPRTWATCCSRWRKATEARRSKPRNTPTTSADGSERKRPRTAARLMTPMTSTAACSAGTNRGRKAAGASRATPMPVREKPTSATNPPRKRQTCFRWKDTSKR